MEDQILDSSLSQQDGPGTSHLVYSTFGSRLGAAIIDGLIVSVVTGICLVVNSFDKSTYFITTPLQIAFLLFYHVYLVQASGATPGKKVVNLKIVRLDGTDVAWKEAIMRYLPLLILGVMSQLITVASVMAMDADYYEELSWMQRTTQIGETYPLANQAIQWINIIWILADIIVFFTNDQRRALHDKIADTVVISTK